MTVPTQRIISRKVNEKEASLKTVLKSNKALQI